jgi:methylaspartate ammonia-lyase
MFLVTIVVNGEIVGTWRRSAKAHVVQITAEPIGMLTQSARAGLECAARTDGEYLGLPVAFVD